MSASAERPCTTKPRGVCKYYSTPRGCFAGSSCKFLHGENERLTPYDKSKTCKFYAAGYCKRGANCWFIHSEPSKSPTKDTQSIPNAFGEDDQLCSICLEKPVTYGLLAGCSHIFCIQCIREWRDPNGKSVEVVDSGVNKKCPLCRAPSQFVTPSSLFYPDTHPGKSAIIAQYKSSMARVPCRHFQASPKHNRFCPFGKDCFYQHLNEDGTEYLFDEGVDHNMRVHRRRRASRATAFAAAFTEFDDPLIYSDDDDDTFNYVEDELSAAMDIIRANLPFLESFSDADGYGNESDSGSSHEERVFGNEQQTESPEPEVQAPIASLAGLPHARNLILRVNNGSHAELLLEAIERLEFEDSSREAPRYRFGTITPTPTTFSPAASRSLVVYSEPDSPARPFDLVEVDVPTVSPPPALDLRSTTPAAETPRFSTVVRRSTIPSSVDNLAESDTVTSLPEPSPLADLENQRMLHAADYSEQEYPPADILAPSIGPSERPAVNLSAASGLDVPEDSWNRSLLELQNNDPPLLTDGRGRVVWSTTPASRSRRGRPAGSLASPVTQHKPHRRSHSADPSSPSQTPRMVANTLPRSSPMADGRGRALFTAEGSARQQ